MARIRSLKPNVTRAQAIAEFSPGGALDLLREAWFGPLRSVAEFYIPFQLFQVEIVNRGQREQRILGLDAVNGSLDLYYFDQLPGLGEVICLETRNCVPALRADARAQELVIAKTRRVLFSRGFFRLRDLRISAEPVPGEIHIPYWIGFRGRELYPRFAVLNAVRRQPEGAKVRRLLRDWLTSMR